ncbi:MAG: acyl-CoA thioesterase [Clostridiales bacterium]|nr:acyl-CoA thioesterase [Clostridiales bacterium]
MYRHIVQYYETNKMGITHHSNYIRWLEEARIDFLSQIGWSYAKLEEEGIISPVVSVECKYMKTTTFMDAVDIEVSVREFKGVKLKLKYIMKNSKGDTVCEAGSEHCFLNEKGIPIKLHKEYPLFYNALIECCSE